MQEMIKTACSMTGVAISQVVVKDSLIIILLVDSDLLRAHTSRKPPSPTKSKNHANAREAAQSADQPQRRNLTS
jgi:hypothetical protein